MEFINTAWEWLGTTGGTIAAGITIVTAIIGCLFYRKHSVKVTASNGSIAGGRDVSIDGNVSINASGTKQKD